MSEDNKKPALSRRQFLKSAAVAVPAAGVAIAVGHAEPSQAATEATCSTGVTTPPSSYTLNYDVVVIGSGGAGMVAALAAVQQGAKVIVVDENYDVGGHAITSGGMVDLGGGTADQKSNGITDSPELVFQDLVFPLSGMAGTQANNVAGYANGVDEGAPAGTIGYITAAANMTTGNSMTAPAATYPLTGSGLTPSVPPGKQDLAGIVWGSYASPFNDKPFEWAYAQANVEAEEWLVANGMVFSSSIGTSHWGAASGTPRTHYPVMTGQSTQGYLSPAGNPGAGYIRPLEAAARKAGVEFLLNYKVQTIFRDTPVSGRVEGVQAAFTGGRIPPGATAMLQPYCTMGGTVPNTGNLVMTTPTITIQANKGVFVATGGASSGFGWPLGTTQGGSALQYTPRDVRMRRQFDTRLAQCISVGGEPYSYQTGDGILMARQVGADLNATGCFASLDCQGTGPANVAKPGNLGVFYGYSSVSWESTSPVYPWSGGSGLQVSGTAGWDFPCVNMAGNRFTDETASGAAWLDPALAPNISSCAPDWSCGPVWAILDAAAVTRQGWTAQAATASEGPLVGSKGPTDPNFCFTASTLAGLVEQINSNVYMTPNDLTGAAPMSQYSLENTITRYTNFANAGVDQDFGKPAANLHPISTTGPYYAAYCCAVEHDWLLGLRIDANAHVLDLNGAIIPGLYAAGEDVGGTAMHGLAKCVVFGYIGGKNAGTGA